MTARFGHALILIGLAPAMSLVAQDKLSITLKAVPGLRFDLPRFAVQPGAPVKLKLENPDAMMHNLAIVRPGKRMDVVQAAIALGADGPKRHYVPDSPDVLWSTRVLQPGQSQTIEFTAPETEGVYPYVCTFPGHGFVMYGAMYVTTRPLPPLETDQHVPPPLPGIDTPDKPGSPHAFAVRLPAVYRTFVRDSGPASIAVGLPGGLSYVWDAGPCRLRYVWRGGFIDNTDHWRGNGDDFSKPLGRIWYRAVAGMPLRIGDPDKSTPGHFLGYRLVDRHPEFRYRLGGVTVHEKITARPDGSGLTRHFKLEGLKTEVTFVTDPESGAAFSSNAGTFSGGRMTLPPERARQFTVTMIERPGQAPIAYWSMNDVTESKTLGAGVVGRAVRFAPPKKNKPGVVLPARARTDELADGLTFAAWFKADAKPAERMTILSTEGQRPPSLWLGLEGKVLTAAAAGLDLQVEIEKPAEWHHVVVTLRDGAFKLYVDGELREKVERGAVQPGGEIVVASESGRSPWVGWLDEVRLYKRVLDDAAVGRLHAREKNGGGAP